MTPAAAAIERNRAAKALKIAEVMRGAGVTADDIRESLAAQATDYEFAWQAAATLAKCASTPSAETRAMVVRELERLEENG